MLETLLKKSTSFPRFLFFEGFGLGSEEALPLDGGGELLPPCFGTMLLTGKDGRLEGTEGGGNGVELGTGVYEGIDAGNDIGFCIGES